MLALLSDEVVYSFELDLKEDETQQMASAHCLSMGCRHNSQRPNPELRWARRGSIHAWALRGRASPGHRKPSILFLTPSLRLT